MKIMIAFRMFGSPLKKIILKFNLKSDREMVSKPQITHKDKARVDEKAQHTR
jgi:hypothetical protein